MPGEDRYTVLRILPVAAMPPQNRAQQVLPLRQQRPTAFNLCQPLLTIAVEYLRA